MWGCLLVWSGVELEGGGRTFLVATAHYPWRGNPTELSTGENLRIGAAKRTAAHLRRFAQHDPSMPIFFMGKHALLLRPRRRRRREEAGGADAASCLSVWWGGAQGT